MSNPITVVGTVTRDPELKFINSGKAMIKFSVVTSKKKKNDDGSWEDTGTTYWDITAWDVLAENAADALGKGTQVVVLGTAESQEWNDKTTGEKKSKLGITAQHIAISLKKSRPRNEQAAPQKRCLVDMMRHSNR
jgi:single-strand DNA-binding protein